MLPAKYSAGPELTSSRHSSRSISFGQEPRFGRPNFEPEPQKQPFERLKSMELRLHRLVELSCVAQETGSQELALGKARESMEALKSLKAAASRLQAKQAAAAATGSAGSSGETGNESPASANSSDQEPAHEQAPETGSRGFGRQLRQPMSTGVGLFELQVMVSSNLAAQLTASAQLLQQQQRSGQKVNLVEADNRRKEAIDLYMDLCKLATNSSSALGLSSSRAQFDSRFLLYRFGLNLGNLHYQMGDHQRALKYFRLTLDRFAANSATSGVQCKSLRAKLMHNLAITLVDMGQTRDAIGCLTQLLDDNQVSASKATGNRVQAAASKPVEVFNANHHQFGLNLMVCQYDCAKISQSNSRNDDHLSGLMSTWRSLLRVDVSHQYERAIDSTAIDGSLSGDRLATGEREELRADDKTTLSAHATDQDGDSLERCISERHKQVTRSLLMGCQLVLAASQLRNQHRGCATITQLVEENSCSNLFQLCVKLLAEAECDSHKSLAGELIATRASKLLGRKGKLNEAIGELKGSNRAPGEAEQQVAPTSGSQRIRPRGSDRVMTGNRNSAATIKNSSDCNQLSAATATNSCLLSLLQFKLDEAIEFGQSALKLDKSNFKSLINLANCYFLANDLNQAELFYRKALALHPSSWVLHYNFAILNRKLNRKFEHLPPMTKSALLKDEQAYSMSLMWRKTILSMIQLALIHQQSGDRQKSAAILSELLPKQSPDIQLLTSKLSTDPQLALSILQKSNTEHPYHLPTAERLIALNIQSFDYEAARRLLLACIRNRPDEERWYQMMAECYRRAADYTKAIETYKIASEIFPQDTNCLKALIKLTDELGLSEERSRFSAKLDKITSRRQNAQLKV